MPTKRTLRRRLADLQRRYEAAIEDRDEAVKDLASRQWIDTHLTSSRDDLAITRTRERDAAVQELKRTRNDLADARRRLAERPATTAELREARREMLLLRRQNRQLTDRLETLQTANEDLYASGALAGVTR